MKQHITVEQLNELSDRGKEKHEEWCRSRSRDGMYDLPLLSIGQMVEFIDEHNKDWWTDFWGHTREQNPTRYYEGELVDALWEAVKEVLNGK